MGIENDDTEHGAPQLAMPDAMARDALKSMLFGSPEPAPRRIGRYRIVGVLGEGGMGMVFRAHDDELSRPVALKVLHDDADGGEGSTGRARLAREAQAMAQLSHPNVVQVHDVGQHEGSVFIAMELVPGQTLREWVTEQGDAAARSRRYTEIVAMFVQAARGLAAAHAVGLVHRDFKPANALVGDDGRLRVLDFGLARSRLGGLSEFETSAESEETNADLREPASASASSMPAVLQETMTVAGAVLGTPAYISPEQLAGQRADAASDQFSFCVALYEALHGVRPFGGKSLMALDEHMRDGTREPSAAGVVVPAWLDAVLDRGLRYDAQERWPSMNTLVEALLDDPARRRRRRMIAAAGLGLLGTIGLGTWIHEQREQSRCEATGTSIEQGWGEARREALRDTFAATGSEIAQDTWNRVQPRLDEWTAGWATARTQACLDARAGRAEDALREDCLERQRWQLSSTLEVFATADREVVAQAVPMVAELPRPQACDEPGGLEAAQRAADSQASQQDLEQVREQLVRVVVDDRAGRFEPAQTQAEKSLQQADVLADEALRAEALLRLGVVLQHRGEHDAAEKSLREAYFAAGGIGYDPVAVHAATELMTTVGHRQSRPRDGHDWSEHARMAMRRMGQDPEQASTSYFEGLGNVYLADGAFPEAAVAFERARQQQVQVYGPDHPAIASILADLSTSYRLQGKNDRAAELSEQALRLAESTLGSEHPEIAVMLSNQGMLEHDEGRTAEAIVLHRRALGIQRAALGPENPAIAFTLAQLGVSLRREGQLDEAAEVQKQAVEIAEASLGPEHPDVAGYHTNLGVTLEVKGQLDQALTHHQRSLAIQAQALGEEHADLAGPLHGIGNILQRRGRHEDALTYFRRELAIQQKVLGPSHMLVAITLDSIGSGLLHLGQLDEAMEHHQRALAIRQQVLGAEHAHIAASHDAIGEVERARGRFEPAIEAHRRALAIREATAGPEHLVTADTLRKLAGAHGAAGTTEEALALLRHAEDIYASRGSDTDVAMATLERGRVLLKDGRTGEAATNLRRTLELWAGPPDDPYQLAQIRWLLAQALFGDPSERTRATELAMQAVDQASALGPSGLALHADVSAWLRTVGHVDPSAIPPEPERTPTPTQTP